MTIQQRSQKNIFAEAKVNYMYIGRWVFGRKRVRGKLYFKGSRGTFPQVFGGIFAELLASSSTNIYIEI